MTALTMTRSRLRLTPLALASALMVSGCAVVPQALDTAESLAASKTDRTELESEQQAVASTVSLDEAIARALKYNRDRRISMMESVLGANALALSTFDMLPQLSARAGYAERDKLAASSSGTYNNNGTVTRSTPATYSVSAALESRTNNLAVSWNVLDFGLSHVRAGQTADRFLIAKERERKAVHNLIQDVRSAYWRAVSSQRLLGKMEPLMKRVEGTLVDARRVETQRLRKPVDALTYQRDLLDIKRSLESLQKDLVDARTTLITLMGLPPGTKLQLKDVDDLRYTVPEVRFDLETLEATALARRPELMESRYQTRISQAEGRAALLALLPGLTLTSGRSYDSNEYLLFDRWTDHGATLSLNLINVFKAPLVSRQARDQATLAKERRLALTAAVLGQVHISRLSFEQARQQFGTATEYLSVVRRITEQMRQQRSAQSAGEMEVIREELAEILSELRRDVAYAELQNSYGRIFVTAGIDPLPETVADTSLDTLRQAVAQRQGEWDQGEVGMVIKPLQAQVKPWSGAGEHRFTFAADTFTVGGKVRYEARLAGGRPLPSWLKFDAATRSFSGNPPSTAGTLEIEVLAANDAGGRARDRFRLQVEQSNDVPVIDAGALQSVMEGGEVLRGRLSARDPDGDAVSFALTGLTGAPRGFSLGSDGSWTFDPRDPSLEGMTEGDKRQFTIAFEARDAQGGRSEGSLRLEVSGRNSVPRITEPAPVEVSAASGSASGTLTAQDADEGSRLTFAIDAPAAPAGFSLESDGRWRMDLAQPAYRRLGAGERAEVRVPVKVSDERGAKAATVLRMTVTGVNDAPQASEREFARVVLSEAGGYASNLPSDLFADPEGKPLALSVTQRVFLSQGPLPAWLTFDPASLRLAATPDHAALAGGARITLVITAADPEGATASRSVELEVQPAPARKP